MQEDPFIHRYPGLLDLNSSSAQSVQGNLFFVSNNAFQWNVWKVSDQGTVIWNKPLDWPSVTKPIQILCSKEEEVFLLSSVASKLGNYGPEVRKLDSEGKVKWQIYTGDSISFCTSLGFALLGDGNVIVNQIPYDTNTNKHNITELVKIGIDGKQLWKKEVTNSYRSIIAASGASNFLVLQISYPLVLRKYDGLGNLLFSKELSLPVTSGWSMLQLLELRTGDIAFCGSVFLDKYPQFFVAKVSASGEPKWTFGTQFGSYENIAWSFAEDSEGNLYAGGSTRDGGGSQPSKAVLLKLTPDGNEVWHKFFGGGKDDQVFSVYRNSNEENVVLGNTWGFPDINGDQKVFLLHMDDNGQFR